MERTVRLEDTPRSPTLKAPSIADAVHHLPVVSEAFPIVTLLTIHSVDFGRWLLGKNPIMVISPISIKPAAKLAQTCASSCH